MNAHPGTRRTAGFTLAEMAIAVVILALLLASAFIPLSTQMELKSIADTQRSLDQIREAIIGFTLANGRLPCPATGTTATSSSTAGQEVRSGGPTYYYCTSATGVVPWATLGVPESDSWGRRFSYRVAPVVADDIGCATTEWTSRTANTVNCPSPAPVSPGNQAACAPSPVPTQSSIALCTLGDISVYTRADSNHGASAYGQYVAAVFVSHGKNGYGAYPAGGGTALPSPTAGTDEAINASGGATTITSAGANLSTSVLSYIFISRSHSATASGCNDGASGSVFCEFDDIVSWVPTTVLVSRLVTAGKLP